MSKAIKVFISLFLVSVFQISCSQDASKGFDSAVQTDASQSQISGLDAQEQSGSVFSPTASEEKTPLSFNVNVFKPKQGFDFERSVEIVFETSELSSEGISPNTKINIYGINKDGSKELLGTQILNSNENNSFFSKVSTKFIDIELESVSPYGVEGVAIAADTSISSVLDIPIAPKHTAISTFNASQSQNPVDSRSLSFIPSEKSWGYYMFNDNFPNKGDNDYDDLVVAYKYIKIQNSSGKVEGMELFFYPVLKYASYKNDFAVRIIKDLPIKNIKYSYNVDEAKSFKLKTGDDVNIYYIDNIKGPYQGVTNQDVNFFSKFGSLAKFSDYHKSFYRLSIEFSNPIEEADLVDGWIDPFVAPQGIGNGYEVHLENYGYTKFFNKDLLGTVDDKSDANAVCGYESTFICTSGKTFVHSEFKTTSGNSLLTPQAISVVGLRMTPRAGIQLSSVFPYLADYLDNNSSNGDWMERVADNYYSGDLVLRNPVAYPSFETYFLKDNKGDKFSFKAPAETNDSLIMTIQSSYKTVSSLVTTFNTGSEDDKKDIFDEVKERYSNNVDSYREMLSKISGDDTASSSVGTSGSSSSSTPDKWSSNVTYSTPGNVVSYSKDGKYGHFVNAWWSKGNPPSFVDNSNEWKILKRTDANGNTLTIKESISQWHKETVYNGGDVALGSNGNCYEAKYWAKGNNPIEVETVTHDWETPWKDGASKCNSSDLAEYKNDIIAPVGGGKSIVDVPPALPGEGEDNSQNLGTPTIPPLIPIPAPEVPRAPRAIPVTDFPAKGYEFFREVTEEHWDWMFPVRGGKYVSATEGGQARNLKPIANPDGSTDIYTLENVKKAVFEYNAWAASQGKKQFLNEGTKKQQAEEFIAFFAKSSQEVGGGWATAPEPWVINDPKYGGVAWRGGLYYIEESGYSSNDKGESLALNYIDNGSAYRPVPKRSYHGRGLIQLSWNYNYGLFSEWLYQNSMFPDLITEKNTLLRRPDYLASEGSLNILSGIWFWMTPQRPKPSSHDVIYGNVYNISKRVRDQAKPITGLPPRNDDKAIPAVEGDTTNQAVFAYRIGTIINIVNGGLECHRASKWHPGPSRRVSYYNVYAKYLNKQIQGLNANIIEDGVAVWDKPITESSNENLRLASCYSQKSYIGF